MVIIIEYLFVSWLITPENCHFLYQLTVFRSALIPARAKKKKKKRGRDVPVSITFAINLHCDVDNNDSEIKTYFIRDDETFAYLGQFYPP